jgi:excisionase family DNA binding protein
MHIGYMSTLSTPFGTRDEMNAAKECRTIKIEEAAKILGISRNTAYEAVKSGQLPTVKIGRRFLVPKAALERMLESAVPVAG